MFQVLVIIFFGGTIAALAAIGSALLRKDRQPQYRYSVIAFLVVAILGGLLSCFTQVSQSHVGVVTTFGHVETDTLGEGPHLVNPVSRKHIEAMRAARRARLTNGLSSAWPQVPEKELA
ncbi:MULTISPECIES: hypothetical protein [unclassified Caballeronia]|uniref:hypothetical protein n=1 Tax=unclassified Caballeronia TaxID=2646786 RepID=UPI00286637AE|nr:MULTISPECIES: hypothetical protein [unclassified Caballeronia]MDR5777369.1 hypothetical protein [Caballeronia sp. LZ002]MDR5802541.1 hypothetical protein [Caballeronia sp. LZ001]MDR5852807.1 hypothetical protein [Caballeronia sp. LZ003]